MKILKWLMSGLLLLIVLVVGGGMLLSPRFTVQRSTLVNAAPEALYPLVAEPQRWKEWSVWTRRDAAMQIRYFGPPAGPGAGWEWHSKSQGDGRMTFGAASPPERIDYELFFPDFGTTSRGDFRFTPEPGGTRVAWTMAGDIGNNPAYRWLALFMDKMVGQDFEAGLANLKAVAEKR